MSAFSRKDYEAIAEVLADRSDICVIDGRGGLVDVSHVVHGIALGLADVFAADNARFDAGKFIEACGL